MRHNKTRKMPGTDSAHRKANVKNLVTTLIQRERIMTTETKAKAVKPVIDRLVYRALEDTVHTRRLANRIIEDRSVIHKLYHEIAPLFKERPGVGGYVRIVKGYYRHGDGAPMVVLEFVEKTQSFYDLEKAREERRKAEKEKKAAAVKKEAQMDAQMGGGGEAAL